MKTGVVVLGHGSRTEAAASVLEKIVTMVRERVDYKVVKSAAMELAEPDLEQSISRIVEAGIEQIVIIPLFIFPGIHIQQDIPELISQLEEKYPEVEFILGQNIGADDKIVEIIRGRIEKAV